LEKAVFLPPRPLGLQPSHLTGVWVGGVFVAVLGIGMFVIDAWLGGQILSVRHEQAVFANGVPALHSSVEGYRADITSLFMTRTPVSTPDSGDFALWRDYVLNVEYTDAQGAVHRHEQEFGTVFGSVDQRADILVRYEPQHPDDYALSWAVSASVNQLAGLSFEILICGLIGAGFLWGAFATIHQGYDARRAAEDGEEVELQVLSVKDEIVNGQRTGNVVYRYLVPGEPEAKARTQAFNMKKAPLMLDEGGHLMLGLRSPRNGGRILLVKHDLSPFAFAADEEKTIRDRLAARRAAGSHN
jgi:hypothetical protein